MTDQERPDQAELELFSVAEALYHHAEATRRAAFDRWYAAKPPGWLVDYTHQGKALQGWEAGWRAALEWYVALVCRPPLADQAAGELLASSASAAEEAGP